MYLGNMLKAIDNPDTDNDSRGTLRGRLLHLQRMVRVVQAENSQLKDKIAVLEHKKNIASVKFERRERELIKAAGITLYDSEFVEYQGAKFKRKFYGEFQRIPFCISCSYPLSSPDWFYPYSCNKCGVDAIICPDDLIGILMDAAREFPNRPKSET